jgi:YbbR domain-containing protein
VSALGGLLHRIFLQDWRLKLFSLFLATILWIFIVGERRSEITLSVPLELTEVPKNLVILSRVPEMALVRLSGPRTLLSGINPQQLSVALNLGGFQPGVYTFENLASRVKLPKRIEVTYISPSAVTLEIDTKAARRVPVRPRIKGKPASGFEVESVRADPAEVEVEGGANLVASLQEIPTEVVDITGLQSSIRRPVELALPNPTLRRLSKSPEYVEVEIRRQ